MKKIVILIFALIVSGCASLSVPPSPIKQPINEGKVGVYISATKYPKHTHIGTTIVNNFVKEYKYDWDMKSQLFNIYKTEIEKNTGLKVVNITNSYPELSSLKESFVVIEKDKWAYNPKLDTLRKKLLKESIKVIAKIEEAPSLARLECSQYGCAEHYSNGYGLFTRSFFGFDNYYASSSFNFYTEVLDPPAVISRLPSFSKLLNYEKQNYSIDMNDPTDFNNITERELEPVKDNILKYIHEVAFITAKYLNGSNDLDKPEIQEEWN